MNHGSPIKTLHSRTAWECPWYSIRKDEIEFPNGYTGEYNVIQRPGAVFIVPQLADGRVVMIKQYRHTVKKWLWEIPAGGVEQGKSPEETAHRELLEEIGGKAASMQLLMQFYAMPGICDERSYMYLAQDVQLGDTYHEDSEIMDLHILSYEQIQDMMRNKLIEDGPTMLGLLYADPYLRPQGQK